MRALHGITFPTTAVLTSPSAALQRALILVLVAGLGWPGLLPAADGLAVRPAAVPYLNVPPTPPVPNGAYAVTRAFPNLYFQGAIAVRPVPLRPKVLWVLEREGRIWSIDTTDPATSTKTLVLDLNDDDVDPSDGTPNAGHLTNGVRWWCQGWDDCGLMGLAFHPDFGKATLADGITPNPNRGYFYLGYQAKSVPPDVGTAGAYYRPDSAAAANHTSNRVARFTVAADGTTADPASEQILIDQPDPHLWHNGGDLFFDNAGYLYAVNGDGGSSYDAYQNTQRITKGLFSGVLRLDVDWTAASTRSHAPPARKAGQPVLYPGYGIPNDNPFVGFTNALEEFYCIGLRSPHRMTYDPVSTRILVGDIGQGQREEVTRITRGSNQQWGYLEGFANQSVDGSIKEERIPPRYAATAALAPGETVIPLSYSAPGADPTLSPGMLAVGDRVRFGNRVHQIQALAPYPHASVTLTTPLIDPLAAATPLIRTTGFQVTGALSSTAINNNVPSGLGTTTIPVGGSGLLSVGTCVSFAVTNAFGSYQIIAAVDDGTNTTSITVRPRLPATATVPVATWVDRLTVIGTEQPPIIDFNHGGTVAFNAVIGGYIYRGAAHPDLVGKYLFADNARGTIYQLGDLDSMTPTLALLLSFNTDHLPANDASANYPLFDVSGYRGLSGFGVDHDGEPLICRMQANGGATNASTGQIWKIVRKSDTVLGTPIPSDLADTGAFATDASGALVLPLRPTAGLIPFGVNAPLWSDQALKSRWISLPNPAGKTSGFDPLSEQVSFAASGAFSYPAGTVFVKHFALEDYAFPDHQRYLETRLLVRSPPPANGVYGVTYKWNAAGTAATLIDEGQSETFNVTLADHSQVARTWSYPSRDDCLTCHNANANHVLGPHARQLNGDYAYPGGVVDNQLRTWSHLGMFANPPADGVIPGLPRLANIADSSASLELRSRSWLDANCSHCHRPGGVHAGFDARFDTPLASQNLIDGAVDNHLGIPASRVVLPGDPASSVLYLRDSSLAAGIKMPPLAKNLVDTQAMGVLSQWILGMTVGITAPSAGAVLANGAPVTIAASVGATTGVTQVEFLVDGVAIGSDASAPYALDWTPATAGGHVLTAVVHDATMATITSAPVAVTVTSLPTIALTAPASGIHVTTPGSVGLTAVAGDADGSIALVEFLSNGVVVGSDATAPYALPVVGLVAGTYSFTARAVDDAGGSTLSAPVLVTVDAAAGLTAQYWNNMSLDGAPDLARVETAVNYNWGTGAPAPGIGVDAFSVRWSGVVAAPVSGTWTFTTNTDDGVRLWVAGQALIDKWVDQGATDWSGTIALTAGVPVPIVMEYYEKTGGASARLSWSGPGVASTVIPASAFPVAPRPPSVDLTTPASGQANAPATIALAATATSLDGTITGVTFLRDGAVIATDSTAPYAASVAGLAPGTYVFTARASDSNALTTRSSSATVTVVKGPAGITLGGLAATYDGTAKNATVTTVPPGLAYTITYDGAAALPTATGAHAVAVAIDDPVYQGTATGSLVIAKATAVVAFTIADLAQTYAPATPRSVGATTVPPGLAVTVSYDGSTTPPTAAGSYALTAVVSDANYQGAAAVGSTLEIAKAAGTVTLSHLTQTIDGSAKPVTVTTVPAGLAVTVTYDNSATVPSPVPSAEGDHAVAAEITDANYSGSATGILRLTSQPVVSLASGAQAEGNAGTTLAVLSATLSLASTATVTVDWTASAGTATAGTDFTAASGTLTFAPGITAQPIAITILGDTTFEPDETVVVTLANPVLALIDVGTATLTITNDDANSAPVITEGAAVAASCDEDNAPIAFALTLHASDADAGQVLTWSLITAPAHGSLAAFGSGPSQAIAYQPAANYNGSDSLTVRVADGAGGSADCVVTITIAPRNDPPLLVSAPVVTLAAVSTATAGTWSDADDLVPGTITTLVQWQRADDAAGNNVADIAGATGTSHALTASDDGKFLRVRVTASDDGEGLPANAATTAHSAYVAVPAAGGGGSGSSGGGGGGGGGGCGLGHGITGLLAMALLLLRRQRLR